MKVIPLLIAVAVVAAASDWPYGGGPEEIRYSKLKQIDRSNVGRLKVAWIYDVRDGEGASQTQPVMANGVVYGLTPKHKVIALDAATGKLLWRFDSKFEGRGPNRGVTYWTDGKPARVFAAIQSYLYALDPRTGTPVTSFGNRGRIDLREGLGRDSQTQSIILTSPGVAYRDLIIVGGRTPESLPAPPGDIRAYDIRSGRLRWSFHTIPHPGEIGYETWPADAWLNTGSANNWAGMALDTKRGILYAPTGSAASDFYGADRLGNNLFANSLLALNAATGKRIWHFQAVKHDIWDRDFPSPPSLVTVRRDGKQVDAVAQTTKQGWLYLFDRANGKPLFPIEEKTFPSSSVVGEMAAETQPMPVKPAPFARQQLTEEMLTNRTPAAHQWALEQFRNLRSQGQFVPLGIDKETVIFPGFDGGAEWGGSALDPETGLLYVNANDVPWTSKLVETKASNAGRQAYLANCAGCHGDAMAGAPPQIPSLLDLHGKQEEEVSRIIREGAGRMPAFPNLTSPSVAAIALYLLSGVDKELENSTPSVQQKYRFAGYHKFLDPDGYPAVEPPWGTLNAINLNTGEFAWKIPLGEYPELAAQGMKNTGTENYGGPMVTAGGLVFIAATNFDRKFRAFDKATGKLLWETVLPLSGNSTPITYERGGKQYIVIHATGGREGRNGASGSIYIAFTLGGAHELKVGVFAPLLSQFSLDDVLTKLECHGIRTMELGTGNYPGDAHCKVSMLDDPGAWDIFKKRLADRGFSISALSCHCNPLHPDAARAKRDREVSRKTILLAEKLGVSVVVDFSGCPGDSPRSRNPNWVTCPWPPEYLEVLKWQWEPIVTPYWVEHEKLAADHGHGESWWRHFASTLRRYGYDGALSMEHEDSLLSPEEGRARAAAFLKQIIPVEPAAAAWWV